MVTIMMYSWTIVSIIIPLLVMMVVGLSIELMDYRSYLEYTKRRLESSEKYYLEYRRKYLDLKFKK